MSLAPTATTVAAAPRPQSLSLPESYRLTAAAAAVIVVFGASMLLINLGSVRALTFHEVIFAEPAREMLRDGHWIVPTIGNVPMLDKTPGTAWCIAASMALFGSEAEWVVRLPIVCFSILTALLVASMTARWFGSRAGLMAGLMELTTVHVLGMGRLAEADMPLCCTVTAALYAFAAAHVDGPCGRSRARWLPWAFHAAVAASFLIKWLLGVAFIGTACAAWLVVSRDWRGLKFLLSPIGLAIELVFVGGWAVAAYRIYPGILDAFWLHHFGRMKGDMGSLEPWYAYVYLIPFLVLPWIPFTAMAAIERRRAGRGFEAFWRWTACWVLPGMLLLSTSSFRSRNYAIPLTPPLVALAAVGLDEYLRRRAAAPGRESLWLAMGLGLGSVAGAAAVLIRQPADAPAIAALIAVGGAGLIASLEFQRRRQSAWQAGSLFATLWLTSVGIQSWIMPSHDSFRPLAELGRRVAAHTPPGATVHLVDLPEVQIPFYIDRPLQSWFQGRRFYAEQAAATGTTTPPLWVVASQDKLEELRAHGTVEVLDHGERKARRTVDRDRLMLVRFEPLPSTAEAMPMESRR
jgi:4-amino-4-deoxy-L-arabinose transferase-like glycosyltransferase